MGNPFDQFDEVPQANPFDQFDEAKPESRGILGRIFSEEAPKRDALDTMAGMAAEPGTPAPKEPDSPNTSVLDRIPPIQTPAEPLINVRGAPVSKSFYDYARRKIDAASPQKRKQMEELPGVTGSVAKAVNEDYAAQDKTSEALPSVKNATGRREDLESAFFLQGHSPEVSAGRAQTALTYGGGTETDNVGVSEFDFDAKNDNALVRGWKDWESGVVGSTGATLAYAGRKAGIDTLAEIGDSMDRWASGKMPAKPGLADEIVSAFGSSASFLIPGMGVAKGAEALAVISRVAAKWAGAGTMAVLEAAAEADGVYKALVRSGKSKEYAMSQADGAFLKNAALITITDKVAFFNDLKAARTATRRFAQQFAVAAPTESFQEAGQQVISNEATGKPLGEGVAKSAGIGALVGGGTAGAKAAFKVRPSAGDRLAQQLLDRVQGSKFNQEAIDRQVRSALNPTAPNEIQPAGAIASPVARPDPIPAIVATVTDPNTDIDQAIAQTEAIAIAPATDDDDLLAKVKAAQKPAIPTQPEVTDVSAPDQTIQSEPATPEEARIAAVRAERFGKVGAADNLQNRDRTREASIIQMQRIAQAPDYELASIARDSNGAPMVADNQGIPAEQIGRPERVTLPDGTKIQTRYAVVEAADLSPSHFADGTPNTAYGSDGKLTALNNGRTAGLMEAYNRGTAADYRTALEADSQGHGIPAESIAGMKSPVLVRVYDASTVDQANLGARSNQPTTLNLAPSEQANTDAARITHLDDLQPTESGEFSSSSGFVKRFVGSLPLTEQAGMMDNEGQLSQAGVARIRNAILSKAYGDSPILQRMTESLDDNMRNITKALIRVAPDIAKMRQSIADGALHNADLTPHIMEAVEELSRLKDQGKTVANELAQGSILGDKFSPETRTILAYLDQNIRRPKQIGDFIKGYIERLESAGNPNQEQLIEGKAPSKVAMLEDVRSQADEKYNLTEAKAQLKDGLSDLGGWVRQHSGVVINFTEEEQQKLLPILVDIFDASITLVGHNIKNLLAAVKKALKYHADKEIRKRADEIMKHPIFTKAMNIALKQWKPPAEKGQQDLLSAVPFKMEGGVLPSTDSPGGQESMFTPDGRPTKAAQSKEFDSLDERPPASKDESGIVNPIDLKASPEEKVKQLVALSQENAPIIDAFIERVDDKYGTKSKSSFKLPENILSKSVRPSILARKPWYQVEHIRDSFRFKTVINSFEDLPGIIEMTRRELGAEIVKVDLDKVMDPMEWGWRIASFDLRMPNGQLVEYYIPIRELESQKKKEGHALFEKWRNKDVNKLTDEEKAARVKDLSGDKFEVKVGKETFTKRKEAGEAILAKYKELADKFTDGRQTLAYISGFAIDYQGKLTKGKVTEVEVKGVKVKSHEPDQFQSGLFLVTETPEPIGDWAGMDPVGMMMRVTNKLAETARLPTVLKTRIQEAENNRKALEPRLDSPFPMEQMVRDKRAQIVALEAELTAKPVATGPLTLDTTFEDGLAKEQELEDAWQKKTGAITPLFSRGGFKPVDTNSPEFKKWFGDSKVVDAEGKPLVVYHGTSSDINGSMSPSRGEGHLIDGGIYLTVDPEHAAQYTKETGGNIMPLYVSLQNPAFDADRALHPTRESLIAAGYDGVINEGYRPGVQNSIEIIAFSPTQIKSAIGNTGEFSSTNPDIRHSKSTTPLANPHSPDSAKTALLAAHTGKIKSAILAMFDAGKSRVVTSEQAAGIIGEDALYSRDQFKPVDTESPEFKKWFGDSKVVDADGNPLRVFHGTNASFDVALPHSPITVYRLDGKEIQEANSWDMGDNRKGMPEGYHYGALTDAITLGVKKALQYRTEEAQRGGHIGKPDTERTLRDLRRLQNGELTWKTESRPSGAGMWFTPDPSYSFISRDRVQNDEGGNVMPVYLHIQNPAYVNAAEIESAGYSFEVERYKKQGYDGVVFASDPKDLRKTGWSGATQIVTFDSTQIKSAISNTGEYSDTNPDIRYSTDGKAVAFFNPSDGVTYFIADHIPATYTAEQWRGLARHEIATHALRLGRDDAEFQSILDQVSTLRDEGDRDVLAAYARAESAGTAQKDMREEQLAYLLQDAPKSTIAQRFLAWFKKMLRAIGDKFPATQKMWWNNWAGKLDTNDLMAMANDAMASWKPAAKETMPATLDTAYALHSEGMPLFARAPGATFPIPPAETKTEAAQQTFQDSFNRFRVVQDWMKGQGISINDKNNVYNAEIRMHGRFANKAQDFRENQLEPLIKEVQKAGFTKAQVDTYLHAQHAEERNIQIAKINPKMPDGGSGMKTATARAILAAADPKLKALANKFQKFTAETKQILLDAGILSKEMVAAWDGAYKQYVPLKGGDETTIQHGAGKGYSVNGKQKRALGHGERLEYIVENIARDRERALLLAEHNEVGKHLLALALDLGNDDIISIGKPEKRGVLMPGKSSYDVQYHGSSIATFTTKNDALTFIRTDGRAGYKIVESKGDPAVQYMATGQIAENEALVYVGGHAIRAQINDEILAREYKKLGVEQLTTLFEIGREVNSWLSKAYTGYNPEFILRNIRRDFTTGLVNVTADYGGAVAARAAKLYMGSLMEATYYSMTGKASPMVELYRKHGGNVGAAYLSDIERIGQDIKHNFDRATGVIGVAKEGRYGAASRVAFEKIIGGLMGWIEHLNAGGENGMRLAVFKALIESGKSPEQAAVAAKGMTLNFNKKGEIGSQMGAMWLFYNPAAQDAARLAKTLLKSDHKAQAWSIVGSLAMFQFLSGLLQFGDDDDGEYRRIPPQIRNKNFIIRTGPGTYINWDVPFGFGWFFGIGNAAYEAYLGVDKKKIGIHLATGFLDNFSPIGNPVEDNGEILPANIAPFTPFKALAQFWDNKTNFGNPIMPDNKYAPNTPDHLRMWKGTKGGPYDQATQWLNNMTGGTKTRPGAIDVSPETLKWMVRTIGGGTATFMGDTLSLATLGGRAVLTSDRENVSGLAPDIREIPIVRGVVKQESIQWYRTQFYEAQKEALKAKEAFNLAWKEGDTEAFDKMSPREKGLQGLAMAVTFFQESIKWARDREVAIQTDKDRSEGWKRTQLDLAEKEEMKLYKDFFAISEANRKRY